MMTTSMRPMEADFNPGFTVIELLVVVSVIAVLISIALPRMEGFREEAKVIKAKAEVRALKAAVESFVLNPGSGGYPASGVQLCRDVLNRAKPLIIDDVLTDPFSPVPAEYRYQLSANGRFYVISSVGRDGNADITGVHNDGSLEGRSEDDIFSTNGTGW